LKGSWSWSGRKENREEWRRKEYEYGMVIGWNG